MKIDFKTFKKLECDEHSTTLQHPSGHSLKIAHKGLSPSMRKELDALPVHLAKGGMFYNPQKGKMSKNTRQDSGPKYAGQEKGAKPSVASKSSNTMPGSPTEAKNMYTEARDQGTDIAQYALRSGPFKPETSTAPKQEFPPCVNPSCKSFGKSHPNCRCYGGMSEHTGAGEAGFFAEGGSVESYCSSKQPHQEGCEYFAGGGGVEMAPQTESGYSSGSTAPSEPQADDVAMTPNEQPQQQDPAPNTEVTPPQKGFADHVADANNELSAETQAYGSDVAQGHITPQTYQSMFAKKDTLGKLGSVFGLLVSGMGSGLTHQPNALLDMWNKQIQNDLDAQQKNVDNKQNFLKINQQALTAKAGANLSNAEAAAKTQATTQTQMNISGLDQLTKITQNMAPGPARDAWEKGLAVLGPALTEQNSSINARHAVAVAQARMLGGGTALMKTGVMGPAFKEYGEDTEQKQLSGILGGKANRPLSEQDKKTFINKQEYDKAAQQYIDYANQYKGNWANLDPKQRAEIANKVRLWVQI